MQRVGLSEAVGQVQARGDGLLASKGRQAVLGLHAVLERGHDETAFVGDGSRVPKQPVSIQK